MAGSVAISSAGYSKASEVVLYFEMDDDGATITVDPEQRELVVGGLYAFRDPRTGACWIEPGRPATRH